MGAGVSSSLYDLTGNLIEETYQRILQIGDESFLYNGTGSVVETLIVSGSVTANAFVGDGSGLTNLPTIAQKTSWVWETGRNSRNVNDQYLRRIDGIFTNVVPYSTPFNYRITDVQARTPDSETWVAEVRKNGVPFVSVQINASNKGSLTGLSGSITPSDDISFYCSGSSINQPTIIAWFEKI